MQWLTANQDLSQELEKALLINQLLKNEITRLTGVINENGGNPAINEEIAQFLNSPVIITNKGAGLSQPIVKNGDLPVPAPLSSTRGRSSSHPQQQQHQQQLFPPTPSTSTASVPADVSSPSPIRQQQAPSSSTPGASNSVMNHSVELVSPLQTPNQDQSGFLSTPMSVATTVKQTPMTEEIKNLVHQLHHPAGEKGEELQPYLDERLEKNSSIMSPSSPFSSPAANTNLSASSLYNNYINSNSRSSLSPMIKQPLSPVPAEYVTPQLFLSPPPVVVATSLAGSPLPAVVPTPGVNKSALSAPVVSNEGPEQVMEGEITSPNDKIYQAVCESTESFGSIDETW
jgi:hypothetical protein